MKILILTDYYPPDKLGGVGEIAKNLKQTYDKKGHETWVLTTGKTKSTSHIIRSSESLIKGVFLNNIRAIQLIRKYGIEIINMHQSTTALFLLTRFIPFLYKRFPKVVNSFQVSYFSEFSNIRTVSIDGHKFKPTKKEHIEKWIFSPIHILLDFFGFIFSDEVTVVSSENKKEFKKTYGRFSKKEIKIIPNGVITKDFTPKKVQLPKTFLKKLDGKIVLLYVGVFRARKRVFNLLFALNEVVKHNKNVILVLVGGGRDYEEDIHNLAKELNLDKNIDFVGRVPNEKVNDYLNASDVFCLLSSYEGMPIAILEAMASGKAILTSDVSGMVDLVIEEENGCLTEVDNLDVITDKLKSLVDNPKKVEAMGRASRQRILKYYDWDKIADQYIKVFES